MARRAPNRPVKRKRAARRTAKRKKAERKKSTREKREAKRIALLKKQGRIVCGVEVPEGAIPGDPSEQNVRTGYSARLYYQDIHYKCAGCGKHEVWTAEQQKKYFEVQKGNIYNEPKWCFDCHQKRLRERKRKC